MFSKIKIFTALLIGTFALTGCGTGTISWDFETSPPKIEKPDQLDVESESETEGESEGGSEREISISNDQLMEYAIPEVRETADGTVAYLVEGGQVVGVAVWFALAADEEPLRVKKSVVTNDGKTLKITPSRTYVSPAPEDIAVCITTHFIFDGAEKVTSVQGADHSCTTFVEEEDAD